MAIRVGIGSWADPEYTGVLYPEDLPAKKRLEGYAKHFDHVEVNSSYYATPKRKVVEGWVNQTPAAFTFTVKLHRAFSQSPDKTARKGELTKLLLEAMQPLMEAQKLSAFLLVLPPSFAPERHQLSELDAVADKLAPHPLAVELRHSEWVTGERRTETLAYFRERKIAWVAVDMPRIRKSTLMPAVDEVTDPRLAYLRLHGRNKNYLEAKTAAEGHTYDYTGREMREIAERVRKLAANAQDVHVIANNHAQDFAPKAALALKRLLEA
jgi:uncharacterized protein YecE (DUF72 family)